MILAIDIGNTHIILGVIKDNKVLFSDALSSDTDKTDLEYAIALKTALDIHGIVREDFRGAIISSVSPSVTAVVSLAVEKLLGKPPLIVGPGIKTGLNIKIENPGQLGSDLVVGAVAAIAEYGAPLIIIDLGTATTFSVIDRRGCYLGGALCPGARVSLNSLSSTAAQLPHIGFDMPKKAIGRNTVDCMRSGSIFGNAAMIDGMIDRIEKELNDTAHVIATGKLAAPIISCCQHTIRYDENLLLKGLNIIYNKNQ